MFHQKICNDKNTRNTAQKFILFFRHSFHDADVEQIRNKSPHFLVLDNNAVCFKKKLKLFLFTQERQTCLVELLLPESVTSFLDYMSM